MGIVTKAGLLAQAERIKAEIEQYRRDVESWNDNRPEADRIDPDPDGSMERCLEYAEAMIAACAGALN